MKKIILITIICAICTQAHSQWQLTGNAGTNASTNFIGTTDNIAFKIRTNNAVRMTISTAGKVGIGITSPVGKLHVKGNTNVSQLMIDASTTQSNINPLIRLRSNAGTDLLWIHSDNPFNTFIGLGAGRVNDVSGGFGIYNTFIGSSAGYSNTTGNSNTANGFQALYSNNTGDGNTAIGHSALYSNTTGNYNTATGPSTLNFNTTGNSNTANGFAALAGNTTASENTAIGTNALWTQSFNNGGNAWVSANTAVGFDALLFNQPVSTIDGINNTAIGHSAMRANTTGWDNTAIGTKTLFNNSTGDNNTATGYSALYNNTSGSGNIATGATALFNNTTGANNIASGLNALYSNTTASQNVAIGTSALAVQSYNPGSAWASANTAIGFEALYANQPTSTTSGINNTAVGHSALRTNTTGDGNTAIGRNALYSNTTGYANTANGYAALYSNTRIGHTAYGFQALYSNTTGEYNTANGVNALYNNTKGEYNISNGVNALYYNTTASRNTAIGNYALFFQSYNNNNTPWFSNNIAIGYEALLNNQPTSAFNGINNIAVGNYALSALTTANRNTAIGTYAGYSWAHANYNTFVGAYADASGAGISNSSVIGDAAVVNASNKVRLGDGGVGIVEGQVAYSWPSDGRFKENIKDDVKGLDFILKLQPVSYNFNRLRFAQHVRQHITPEKEKTMNELSQIRTVGFVAQDVEKIIEQTGFTSFDAVHAPTNETDNYSMGYAEFVVPLVKAVQELSKENDELKSEIEIIKSVFSSEQKQKFDAIKNETKSALEQNSPNPFNTQTEIKFQLPSTFSSAQLIITDANGKQVRSDVLNSSSSVIIHASELAAGTYSYSLIIDGVNVDSKQMVLTK